MTDIIKGLNIGTENLKQDMRASMFRKGAEAINLNQIFGARGINFGPEEQ